ncbi:HupE/UreJ family protein [Mycolicibacterium palauense]|uniref:HupE/UreJ family protein n=1 Tax=Mycolicibacterium palauense TaxID=2034511 RepID=UPI000BFF1004|nr:HupE/UreJ family protein [Mycolicibacterium palauense]
MAAAALVLIASCASAAAHPLSTTAILLDLGAADRVTGQIQLPIDRMALALDEPLTAATVAQPQTLEELHSYVAAHIGATQPSTGAAWGVNLLNGRVGVIDGVGHLIFDITLDPPEATALGDFDLHCDAIVHHLLSHRIFVATRTTPAEDYVTLGVLDWQSHTITVARHHNPTAAQFFVAAIGLGIKHIAEGADHLLFLIMLLLPAPLLARRGRWVCTNNPRRSTLRVVHVVTAFTVGHSATLALGAVGLVHLPSRLVESLIALSILVSAVHAIKPIVRGGEVCIAAGFGLMHGLAFAALLGQLELGRDSLVGELLGFNVGIELTQLMIVALIMPSLWVFSCTRAYPLVRTLLAVLGVVLGACWLSERIALTRVDPSQGVSEALTGHPLIVAGSLAVAASSTWMIPALRLPTTTTEPSRNPGVACRE